MLSGSDWVTASPIGLLASYLRMDSRPRRPCRLPEAPRLPSQATKGVRSSYLLTRHLHRAAITPVLRALGLRAQSLWPASSWLLKSWPLSKGSWHDAEVDLLFIKATWQHSTAMHRQPCEHTVGQGGCPRG